MNYKAMIIGETPGTLFSIEGNGDNSVIIKESHNNVDVVSDTSKSVKIETKTIEPLLVCPASQVLKGRKLVACQTV